MNEQVIEYRDYLALRKMRGKHLTDTETLALEAMNRYLDSVLPASAPLPDDVLEAMYQVSVIMHHRERKR